MKTPPDALALRTKPEQALAIAKLIETARDFMGEASAPATRRAYASDWRSFAAWGAGFGFEVMPASTATLVLYLSHLASSGKKVSTIVRAKAAISVAHDIAKEANPTHAPEVKRALKGIRRSIGVAPEKKKALLGDDIERLVRLALATKAAGAKQTPSVRGFRDAALLSLGFAGGFRRSELVAIHVEHLDFQPEGVVVFIPKSKTDQEGVGRRLGVPHALTVDLLKRWLELAGIKAGPVFRAVHVDDSVSTRGLSSDAVAEIVKKYAVLAGLDPKRFAGHSLRRGFITHTIREGKNERDIMRQTGHKSTNVFRGYVEEASVFIDNAAKDLWG
jgi:integrase